MGPWNAQSLLCRELARARRKQAFLVSLLCRLDVLVVQEAHCPDLSYVELERVVARTHRCIWQAAEGDRPVGGLGFFVKHRLLQDFSSVSLRPLGRSGRMATLCLAGPHGELRVHKI